MLRPLVLAAFAPAAALALCTLPAAAEPGIAGASAGGRPGMGAGPSRGPAVHAIGGRGQRGFGQHRFGQGRYGYGHGRYGQRYGYGGGYGHGGGFSYGGGYGASVVEGPPAAQAPDWGYRIVTAPGMEVRPSGRPVVYLLDAPPRRGSGMRAVSRHQPYGGAADPEYGPRIVSLSVPRR